MGRVKARALRALVAGSASVLVAFSFGGGSAAADSGAQPPGGCASDRLRSALESGAIGVDHYYCDGLGGLVLRVPRGMADDDPDLVSALAEAKGARALASQYSVEELTGLREQATGLGKSIYPNTLPRPIATGYDPESDVALIIGPEAVQGVLARHVAKNVTVAVGGPNPLARTSDAKYVFSLSVALSTVGTTKVLGQVNIGAHKANGKALKGKVKVFEGKKLLKKTPLKKGMARYTLKKSLSPGKHVFTVKYILKSGVSKKKTIAFEIPPR
jgi:hypothetical protein